MNKPANLAAVGSESQSRDEACALVDRITETVRRLDSLMQQETELIRAARLGDAARLVDDKATLSGLYQRELEAVRAAAGVIGRLVPERSEALRQELAGLQQTLSVNLAVVGTARAVAEDMMRTVADEVAQRERPAVYGASGTTAAQRPRSAPVSLSRQS